MRSELADDNDIRELIEEFVGELPARYAQMRALTSLSDRESLRAMAHQLKGAGGGYGYPAITQAAAHLERAILGGGSQIEVVDRLEALVGCCDAAVAGMAGDRTGTPVS